MGLGGVAIATLPSVIFPKLMFSDRLGGAIFRCNNLLIRKEIDTQPPNAQGKLITLCNEL